MSTTQPIRNKQDIEKLKNYYLHVNPNPRNYTLIVFGLNSALRISDILSLHWNDIYDFNKMRMYEHIELTEKKTKKIQTITLNRSLKKALYTFYGSTPYKEAGDYVFFGAGGGFTHLSRSQAYRIIKSAGENIHLGFTVSCHSLRKTFGYQAWRAGISPVIIMEIYNHSSYSITKKYLCINQDEKDKVFLKINL